MLVLPMSRKMGISLTQRCRRAACSLTSLETEVIFRISLTAIYARGLLSSDVQSDYTQGVSRKKPVIMKHTGAKKMILRIDKKSWEKLEVEII